MKYPTIFLATLVLTCFALAPATARADDLDDLEVTMEVFDDLGDLEGEISEMDGPDRADIRAGEEEFDEEEAEETTGDDEPVLAENIDDREARDDVFEEDPSFEDEGALRKEDDFASDEGEHLDLDEFDQPEVFDDMAAGDDGSEEDVM